MAAPQRPEQGHSRYPSSDTRRVAMPRRSTKGPLDVDVSDRSKSYTELPTTNTSTTNRIAALTSTHFHAYANSIACLVSTLSRRPTESRISTNAFQKSGSENHATGSFSAASSFSLWKYRLADLGLRVAGELIEMGELETAKRHLDTLSFAAAAAASTDDANDDTNDKIETMPIFLLTLNTILNPAIPNPGTPLALLNFLLRPRPLIFTLPHRAASLNPTPKTQPRNRIPLHQQRNPRL
ncbi:hypothetical protein KCU92_g9725, partial [Aureobasidium melanogenum]